MKGWRYILWYKEGSIAYIGGEYRAFRKEKKNYKEWVLENGKEWNDYVTGIDYNEYRVNLVEYGLCRRYVHKGGGGGRENVRRSGKSFGSIPTFSWAGRTCRL